MADQVSFIGIAIPVHGFWHVCLEWDTDKQPLKSPVFVRRQVLMIWSPND